MPIWEEGEGAPRPLRKLRLEILGTEEECSVDPWGNWRCEHNHPQAPVRLNQLYEEVIGWTAQGFTDSTSKVKETIVRPTRLPDF